ncbi:MAG: 30S ribosomal protein S2 [Candidatus Omnitrophica bacterium]|nr:30S ribosomal protein S2 [Candidatus Omnitrophota bacterium]
MALPEAIKDLLENGVHFGHLSKHWNPRMKRFIFGKKKNVYVIDLEKTAQELDKAKDFVSSVAKRGGKILFVATKKQIRHLIKDFAVECDMSYVVERWVGGFLTNFSTVRTRVKKYIELLERKESGDFDRLSGKEVSRLNREINKMDKNYRGVTTLDEYPKCVIVVDPKREVSCVREANRLSIPVVALIDTDADPDVIDYPIPGNDDAIKSVGYVIKGLVEAIKDGTEQAKAVVAEELAVQEKADQEANKETPVKEEEKVEGAES